MLKKLLIWLYPDLVFREDIQPTSAPEPVKPEGDEEDLGPRETPGFKRRASPQAYKPEQPKGATVATMDSSFYGAGESLSQIRGAVPDSLFDWYVSQTFIGFTVCAQIAQHWLVDKACSMPARDAIRQGYEIKADSQEIIDAINAANKRMKLDDNMREMIHFGRVYGQRLVLYRVLHTDPDYYEKPFNLDAVGPGMYMGMSQIDPQWITPELTGPSLQDPASPMFYEPEYYRVWNMRIHRTHLHKYVPFPVPDVMKPRYFYGGVSVPQRVYERVYAAERTANEAPILVMTKRLNVLQISAAAMARFKSVMEKLAEWCGLRDNHGVLTIGDGEKVEQHDTGLTDLDAVIMTQYQLVAAEANVPATKLLGTTPKGFNASGEYEEATYREELESIQTNDLKPMAERHIELVMRSEGLPGDFEIMFEPLDSPTALEWADINSKKATTDKTYIDAGVLTAEQVQERLVEDRNSDYHGLNISPPPLMNELLDDETNPEAPGLGG